MFKKVIYYLITLVAVVAVIYWFWGQVFEQNDSGYVLIGIGQWSLETSLAFLSVILLILFIAFYIFFRWLGWVLRLPGKVKSKG